MPHADDSATILLLRDRPKGLEVFMLKRHMASSFMGGAYVFPGGKLDPIDSRFPSALVSNPEGADIPLRVAAIRETFEECGVLLAVDDQGRYPSDAELRAMGSEEARSRLQDRSDPWDWSEWLQDHGFTLRVDQLGYSARWITPELEPKRFDARFYIAAVPETQDARHDDVETTHSAWVRPVDALAAGDRGDALIVAPTRKNLEGLLPFTTAAEAVEHAHTTPNPAPIMPTMVTRDGVLYVTHPSFGEVRVPSLPS